MRYFSILNKKTKPKYLKYKHFLQNFWKVLEECKLCERKCGINRLEGKIGWCGVGKEIKIFGSHLHWGEEPELIPSGTIFFSGCTLRCYYCQNAPESIDYQLGQKWSFEKLRMCMQWMERIGAKNINLVGGDPTPYIPHISRTLSKINLKIPIIFNSNSYYSSLSAKILSHIIDLSLLDFRYWCDACAERLSLCQNYAKVARRNILRAKESGDLIIRVLVLPNHIECDAKPILEWIRKALGKHVRLNIMSQYRPMWHANEQPDINRPLNEKEWNDVVSYAKLLGFDNALYS